MMDSIQPRHNRPERESTGSVSRPKKIKHFKFRLALAVIMLALLATGIFVGSKIVIFAQKILEGSGTEFSFKRLFLAGDKKLQGEDEGEIRILLLGIGGENHEGGTLTDTMILATLRIPKFKDEKTRISFVSIPRDLVVNIRGYDYRKINSAYAFGEVGGLKQGPALTLRTVEEVLNAKIPYYAVLDFDGFKRIIDDLGGVEINVEAGFTDSLFPDEGFGYLPPVTFEPGLQKMDGQRALQYVRSRHGNNDQGSDFMRSKRQQQLLKAMKDKVNGLKILTNLNLLNRTLENLADHIRTNIEPVDAKRFYELTKNIESENISALAIDVESGLVCNQIVEETGAYILVPCSGLGDYQPLRNLVNNQFLIGDLQKEQPVVEIQTTAGGNLRAQEVKERLALPSLPITVTGLKSNAAYEEGIIYDNTKGQKTRTLRYLQDRLRMRLASSPFPFPTETRADFVIVVTGISTN